MLPMGGATRPWASMSPIQALVERACDPTLPEPNYAVNVELAEYINQKKANSARDATKAILVHINSRNPNQSLLALTLLDHLVHSCGYPIHLQISTKEFLNELVRRFPERPPMITGRVMGRILELIHEWKNTLCVHSKYKEDLVHIRDMHRLLSYKGYRFKSFDATRAMASANPNENLKSPEELEEEDRAAKSAKLQELIRRGTPRDLAAAQELMKALAGAEPDKAPDYTSQTLSELDKVQQKAILLNDMLNNAHQGEKIGIEGDVYDQVAAACKGARPKIQRWIEEDGGDREGMMDRLLLCNDLINNALERFEACKAGDWAKAQSLVDSINSSSNNNQPSDLIQFDAFADEEPLSGDGGLSLPTDSTSHSGMGGGGLTSSGLPLDLFSAPSPGLGSSSSTLTSFMGSQRSGGAVKQNPMDFFASSTSSSAGGSGNGNGYGYGGTLVQPQPPRSGQTQNSSFGPSISSPPYQSTVHNSRANSTNTMYGNFVTPSSTIQNNITNSTPSSIPGYSLSPQPLLPQSQSQTQTQSPYPNQFGNQNQLSGPPRGNGSSNKTETPQTQTQKKDAFADLVDLMS